MDERPTLVLPIAAFLLASGPARLGPATLVWLAEAWGMQPYILSSLGLGWMFHGKSSGTNSQRPSRVGAGSTERSCDIKTGRTEGSGVLIRSHI